MAGYKRPQKTYKLQFSDEEYAGLEVEMGGASLGVIMNLQHLSEQLNGQDGSNAALVRQMMEIFSSRLLSWNLVDGNDQPVPTTVDGLATQDMAFVMSLIAAWTQAVAGVSPPLADGSRSGEPSLEASLTMAPPSVNPAS